MWSPATLYAAILGYGPLSANVVGSAGCGSEWRWKATPGESSSSYNIHSDHLHPSERHAFLHLPEEYSITKPAPLIIALHGKNQPPAEFEKHTQFSNPAFNKNSLVVYPEGVKLQWTGDPESPFRSEVDDIAFIDTVIEQLTDEFCIDRSRIYAAGFSNGGGLTHLLACDPQTSSKIAAFAASSGAFYKDEALKEPLFSHCLPHPPTPYLSFHGDSDPVIHYDGKTTPDGPTYSIPEWLDGWTERNDCVSSKTSLLHGGKVNKTSWTCSGHSELVTNYLISGFGHGWPTTTPLNNDEQRHGPTYFNATPLVLDFFQKNPLVQARVSRGARRDEL